MNGWLPLQRNDDFKGELMNQNNINSPILV